MRTGDDEDEEVEDEESQPDVSCRDKGGGCVCVREAARFSPLTLRRIEEKKGRKARTSYPEELARPVPALSLHSLPNDPDPTARRPRPRAHPHPSRPDASLVYYHPHPTTTLIPRPSHP